MKKVQREQDTAEMDRRIVDKQAKHLRENLVLALTAEAGCRASYESELHRLRELRERMAAERTEISDRDLQNTVLEQRHLQNQ